MLEKITENLNGSSSVVVLVPDLVGGTDCLQFLHTLRARPDVHVDVPAVFQDEAVALVHVRHGKAHLADTNVAFALDLEEPLLAAVVGGDVLEAARVPAGHVPNAVSEVA